MQIMRSWGPLLKSVLLVVILTVLFSFSYVQSSTIKKRDIASYSGNREKKPFCNAFTGCGKKRSHTEGLDVATEAELNDLARHVLAEARLWEQLQSKVDTMRAIASQMEDQSAYRRKRSVYPLSAESESKVTDIGDPNFEDHNESDRKKTEEIPN